MGQLTVQQMILEQNSKTGKAWFEDVLEWQIRKDSYFFQSIGDLCSASQLVQLLLINLALKKKSMFVTSKGFWQSLISLYFGPQR